MGGGVWGTQPTHVLEQKILTKPKAKSYLKKTSQKKFVCTNKQCKTF